MELTLLSSKNLPEGAIYSIRAGAVRRQAPITLGRPLRFPSKPLDGPLKVDVYKPVGCAYVVLRPGEDQYKICFSNMEFREEMACEVLVKPLEAARQQAPTEDPPLSKQGARDEAEDYLETHQVKPFVKNLLQTLMHEKPQDPFAFMARHCASGYEQVGSRTPTAAVLTRTTAPEAKAQPPAVDNAALASGQAPGTSEPAATAEAKAEAPSVDPKPVAHASGPGMSEPAATAEARDPEGSASQSTPAADATSTAELAGAATATAAAAADPATTAPEAAADKGTRIAALEPSGDTTVAHEAQEAAAVTSKADGEADPSAGHT